MSNYYRHGISYQTGFHRYATVRGKECASGIAGIGGSGSSLEIVSQNIEQLMPVYDRYHPMTRTNSLKWVGFQSAFVLNF